MQRFAPTLLDLRDDESNPKFLHARLRIVIPSAARNLGVEVAVAVAVALARVDAGDSPAFRRQRPKSSGVILFKRLNVGLRIVIPSAARDLGLAVALARVDAGDSPAFRRQLPKSSSAGTSSLTAGKPAFGGRAHNEHMLRKLALTLILVSALAAQDPPSPFDVCMDKALTQGEMNECAGDDAARAQQEMEATHAELLKHFADDPLSLKKIKAAQAAWLAYMDAHIQEIYPSEEPRAYGSVHPMCVAIIRADLMRQRTKMLRKIMERQEGDVCRYSDPPKL